jgi:hypothetical protein
MMRNKNKYLKITLYILATYLLVISIIECLATARLIAIPKSEFLFWFNGIYLLIGGFTLGIIFIKSGGTWNKIIGWFFILDNIIMIKLFFEALV